MKKEWTSCRSTSCSRALPTFPSCLFKLCESFRAVRLSLWPLESVHDGLMLIMVNFLPNCTFPAFIRQLNGNLYYSSISIQKSQQWKALINHEPSINFILIRYPINRAWGHAHGPGVANENGSLHWPGLSLVDNKQISAIAFCWGREWL